MDTSIFTTLFEQVWHSPASLLVIAGISVIAYLLEIWPNFNSRFIPIVCILLGPIAYPLFSSTAGVPKDFPHPIAVLIVNGLIAGLIASIIHAKLTTWLMNKFSDKQNPPKDSP